MQAPLVFGVTGHRDLREQDIPELEKKVRDVLLEFRARYRSTPFILLSPLAEGADRLVARVALGDGIGARLVAPLPMPQSMYEADFTAPGSLNDFHTLLAKASYSFEIPCLVDEDTVRHPGPARDKQYEKVGKYIARESQILIALWDGTEPTKVGGTAAIVKFQTEGIRDREDCDLTPPELFPVYHIVTPRVSNPDVVDPLELKITYPPAFANPKDAADYYHRTFSNLEEFNRETAEGGDSLWNEAVKSRGWVVPDSGLANLAPGEALTLHRYAIADALALRYQTSMMHTHRALHWLVFVSFLCFVLFAHLEDHPGPALALSLLLLAVAYGCHLRGQKLRLDIKNQDYRAMAEACRVRLFWQMADIQDQVADHYLGKQRTELDWIRYGLRGWRIEEDAAPRSAWSNPADRLGFILNHWVRDQRDYFKKKSKEKEEHARRMESWVFSFLCLAVGFGVALGLAVAYVQYSVGEWWRCPECVWTALPVILIDAFLAAGALLHHANQRRAHAELRKQYTRMINIFENALRATGQKPDPLAAHPCLKKLGQEALLENGDWVLLHRERPLELPHP
ncbi:MAG TPA: hypothetical protein VEU96_09245 [Bryobacteraceae bacterium]|nr:hypothetical protein [Bryobacteraceae bacterium]